MITFLSKFEMNLTAVNDPDGLYIAVVIFVNKAQPVSTAFVELTPSTARLYKTSCALSVRFSRWTIMRPVDVLTLVARM